KVFDPPHAKAEQDALLDPEVDAPLIALPFSGAHCAGIEPLLEFIEERQVLVGKLGGRGVEELLNAFCQFHCHCHRQEERSQSFKLISTQSAHCAACLWSPRSPARWAGDRLL